jgi:hypothetical protein
MILSKKTLEKLRILINEETQYRSGPLLVEFFNDLGFNNVYGQGFPSRWFYTDEKLSIINGTADLDKCIKKLFAPINFIGNYDKLDKHIFELNQYMAYDKWKVLRIGADITFKKVDKIEIDNPKYDSELSEDAFLNSEFKDVNIEKLLLNDALTEIINCRLEEVKRCIKIDTPLSVIFLCGSILEGVLLGVALKFPKEFNQATSSPKDADGKVKKIHNWTLSNLIDVSCEIGFLNYDVKKYSHVLREFRNYIHPFEQMSCGFNPDKHTAKISWQVLKAALNQLTNSRV